MKKEGFFLLLFLVVLSLCSFLFYSLTGQALFYNDAKSHLDIARRVVEGLTPGFVQLGGVWLPLPHLLMLPTIWNDFFWHSGLSGAIPSMISFVVLGLLIYTFLQKLGVTVIGRLAGVLAFALNSNILYLQSTAMTELLLLVTMFAGCYELYLWHQSGKLYQLIKAGFWIMLATLIRYDGWFLFGIATLLVLVHTLKKFGIKGIENTLIPFIALGGLGIALWLAWNQVIFHDMFYFILGQYTAHEQQVQLESLGILVTKYNISLSVATYIHALIANAGWIISLGGALGAIFIWFDKRMAGVRFIFLALFSPLIFNILSLYFGYSALFVPGVSGDVWFNARYGLLLLPTLALFSGYLVDRIKPLRLVLLSILIVFSSLSFVVHPTVVIEDARAGGSGSDVSKVSNWLATHISTNDYILVSTSSHDQIIFSSGLPMKQFVHQGTGFYWDLAIAHPERYVRFIIVRTGDDSDLVFRMLAEDESFKENYTKIDSFPFADVYELKPGSLSSLRPFPLFK